MTMMIMTNFLFHLATNRKLQVHHQRSLKWPMITFEYWVKWIRNRHPFEFFPVKGMNVIPMVNIQRLLLMSVWWLSEFSSHLLFMSRSIIHKYLNNTTTHLRPQHWFTTTADMPVESRPEHLLIVDRWFNQIWLKRSIGLFPRKYLLISVVQRISISTSHAGSKRPQTLAP